MPEKKKILYSQEALFPDIVGGGGGRTRVTNTISDVQSLQSIVAKCDQTVYFRITIHLHSSPQLHITLKKQNDNSGTFRAIATEKCMSHQMAKKCAGSGLLFMHLQLAFQRDGVHEFYD